MKNSCAPEERTLRTNFAASSDKQTPSFSQQDFMVTYFSFLVSRSHLIIRNIPVAGGEQHETNAILYSMESQFVI
jgi:hypothetical protein